MGNKNGNSPASRFEEGNIVFDVRREVGSLFIVRARSPILRIVLIGIALLSLTSPLAQLWIRNGDFAAMEGWNTAGSFKIGAPSQNCQSCPGFAYVQADDAQGVLYQDLTLPAGLSRATLQFSYFITTSEPVASGVDALNVWIRPRAGAPTEGTVAALNDTNASAGYKDSEPFDLSPWIGKSFRLEFFCITSPALLTTFRIDDVRINVQYMPPAADLISVSAPSQVRVGDAITVSVTAKNTGGPAGANSTINTSLLYSDGSFAFGLPGVDEIQAPWGRAIILSPNQGPIYNANCSLVSAGASHLLIEAGSDSWPGGVEQTLKYTIIPQKPGTILVRTRVTLRDSITPCTFITDTSLDRGTETTDQQGWPVRQLQIEVLPSLIEPLKPLDGLRAEANNDSITLRWNDSFSDEDRFQIERKLSGTEPTFFDAAVNNSTFTDTGALSGVTYCYRVRAMKGETPISNWSDLKCASWSNAERPDARFSISDKHPNTGKIVRLEARVRNSQWNYRWETSANHIIDSQTAEVRFDSEGQHWVSLTVTADGQTNSQSTTIPVTKLSVGNDPTKNTFSLDPVNLASGSFTVQHQDLKVAGKGLSFDFTRTYNSKSAEQTFGALGYGWTHSYEIQARTNLSGVSITFGDGHAETFFRAKVTNFVAEPGVYKILREVPKGWILEDKALTQWAFSIETGLLESIKDRNGNTIRLGYAGGKLTNLFDTSGRSFQFHNDEFGRMTNIIDRIGRSVFYRYDTGSNLVAVVGPRGFTNTFEYNERHQITDARSAKGIRYVHNDYDTNTGAVTNQLDALGNATTFLYDFDKRITEVQYADKQSSFYEFDSNLLLIRTANELGHQERFTYDENRNRIQVIDRNGNTNLFVFDKRGNLTNRIDALGNATQMLYGTHDDLVKVEQPFPDVQSTFGYTNKNLAFSTNALGGVTSVFYASGGLPAILIDANGNGTTNLFDEHGNITNVVNAMGFTNQFVYDAVSRRVMHIDPNGRTNRWVYDESDNVVMWIDGMGHTNRTLFDEDGNVSERIDPHGAVFKNRFDLKGRLNVVENPLRQTATNLYDSLDRKIETFDFRGNPTTYGYDAAGRLAFVTNALLEVTALLYDRNGNLISEARHQGYTKTTFYDPSNRLIGTSDPAGQTTNILDALGRVVSSIDAEKRETAFRHDALGRVTNVIDAAGGIMTFEYDPVGNRTHVTDPNTHTWTNKYDRLNRSVEEIDPFGNRTLHLYDGVGNRIAITNANGTVLQFSYDGNNRLTNVVSQEGSVSFAYDEAGNRRGMVDSTGRSTWTFDALARIVSFVGANGLSLTNEFDENGNRTALIYPGNQRVVYGYDSLNRMTNVTDWLGNITRYSYCQCSGIESIDNADGTKTHFGYDPALRLTALTNYLRDGTAFAFYHRALDGVGNTTNRIQYQPLVPIVESVTNTYSYDAANRLTRVDDESVGHDQNGNITNWGNRAFLFDSKGHLRRWQIDDITSEADYDGLGNRTSNIRNQVRSDYLVDTTGMLSQILAEVQEGQTNYYIYGVGLLAQISGDRRTQYHFDLLGSTVALTDSSGTITDAYAYDLFGTLADFEGEARNPFLYLGKYGIVDNRDGLLFARRRYFIPELGRFVSPDPLWGSEGSSQSFNRYAYALNNPLRFNDVSGLVPGNSVSSGSGSSEDPSIHLALALCGFEQSAAGAACGVYDAYLHMREGHPVWAIVSLASAAPLLGFAADVFRLTRASSELAGALVTARIMGTSVRTALNPENLRLTQTVANHLTDVVKSGVYKGQLARPYLNSTLTVGEIMAAKPPVADPSGIPSAVRWDVPGAFRGSSGTWELVVDSMTKTILHYNFVTPK